MISSFVYALAAVGGVVVVVVVLGIAFGAFHEWNEGRIETAARRAAEIASNCIHTAGRWLAEDEPTADLLVDLANDGLPFRNLEGIRAKWSVARAKADAALKAKVAAELSKDDLSAVPEESLLHHLWTKAVGTPGYVKADWREFANYVERLESIARGGAPVGFNGIPLPGVDCLPRPMTP